MRCRSFVLVGTLGVLALTTVSAPALAADRTAQGPAPAAHAAGLLDGLGGGSGGGLLGGLLGSQQQPLRSLLALLQGGQMPTADLLDPLQTLLDQLASGAGLPAGTQDLVEQLRTLLASGAAGDSLPASVLMPVAALLRDLAGTDGVPSEMTTLLEQIADALDGDGTVAGLPIADLSLPTALITRLDDALRQLEHGDEPTGQLLQPVADLLGEVAASDGLPPATAQLFDQLSNALDGTVGALDPLLRSQVTLALRTIAGTPGVSSSTSTTLERIVTLLGSSDRASNAAAGSRPRTATVRDRAVIKRVRVNRARTRIGVRIACPRNAPATCATRVSASFAGRKAATGKRVRIAPGHAKRVRLRMLRTARSSSVAHGGRLRVRVTTSFGSRRFAVAKTVRLLASGG